jgi:hypothetical protein
MVACLLQACTLARRLTQPKSRLLRFQQSVLKGLCHGWPAAHQRPPQALQSTEAMAHMLRRTGRVMPHKLSRAAVHD